MHNVHWHRGILAPRGQFPIPHSSRIATNKPNVTCTPLWCIGTITCYLPKTIEILCSFHTLPIIKGNYFLQPQIEGTFIDSSNVTYKLTDCVPTDRGLTCNGLLQIMEPCLLTHSINLCILTVYPLVNFSVLYEVEPQHVGFASSNTAELLVMGLSSPCSGCLQHLKVLHWNGDVFYLVPNLEDNETLTWILHSLRPPPAYLHLALAQVLQNSQLLAQHLLNNTRTLAEHRLATTIVANQLQGLWI